MTAAVLDRPRFAQPELDGGGTLEEMLDSALEQARGSGSTECPVCHARMSLTRAGAREAECGGCGSRLS
jgi:transcription initiation factor IIE alpha subunit